MPDSAIYIYPLSPAPYPLLVCLQTVRYLSKSRLVVLLLHDSNVWSSAFNHVVHLDTYFPEYFNFLHLQHWFGRISLGLYHCSERGRPCFSHRLQWTISATLSCLFLYSSCSSLLHSLVNCATVSALSLHILHLTSPSCLSIFTLMTLVLSAWSCAAVRVPSVSFFRLRSAL